MKLKWVLEPSEQRHIRGGESTHNGPEITRELEASSHSAISQLPSGANAWLTYLWDSSVNQSTSFPTLWKYVHVCVRM